jgi:hypothetical protein
MNRTSTTLLALTLACAHLGTVLAQNSESGAANSGPFPVLGPRIEFASTNYDFGTVTAGVVVTYDFIFTNTGDRMLEITNVIPACCLTLGKWDREVAPGQTGKIPIRFDSSQYNGPFRKTVLLAGNATNPPFPVLHFRGAIWKPIDVTPRWAVFTPLADGQSNETKTVRIVNLTGEPLTLLAPECGSPAFKAELKTVTAGKEFELLISLAPPFSRTNISAPITIRTSCQQAPTLRVNVFVMPRP